MPARLSSKKFATGWRRFFDWFELIEPAAWVHEHNHQHHYKLGEPHDPDQPELNMLFLRDSRLPMFLRYIVVFFGACTWKFIYFATNTQNELHHHRHKLKKLPGERHNIFASKLWLPFTSPGWRVWFRCWIPYIVWKFGILPLPFLLFGKEHWLFSLVNMLLAELVANLHSFLVIVPNHAGDDLYKFSTPINNRAEFYLRQILGSANYKTGGDLNDYLYGFLNYQIEHHLWPDLPPSALQRAQPDVQRICQKHGIPYVQESIVTRIWKLLHIMTGSKTMISFEQEVQEARIQLLSSPPQTSPPLTPSSSS